VLGAAPTLTASGAATLLLAVFTGILWHARGSHPPVAKAWQGENFSEQ
jgi:hypothetical protein